MLRAWFVPVKEQSLILIYANANANGAWLTSLTASKNESLIARTGHVTNPAAWRVAYLGTLWCSNAGNKDKRRTIQSIRCHHPDMTSLLRNSVGDTIKCPAQNHKNEQVSRRLEIPQQMQDYFQTVKSYSHSHRSVAVPSLLTEAS